MTANLDVSAVVKPKRVIKNPQPKLNPERYILINQWKSINNNKFFDQYTISIVETTLLLYTYSFFCFYNHYFIPFLFRLMGPRGLMALEEEFKVNKNLLPRTYPLKITKF